MPYYCHYFTINCAVFPVAVSIQRHGMALLAFHFPLMSLFEGLSRVKLETFLERGI